MTLTTTCVWIVVLQRRCRYNFIYYNGHHNSILELPQRVNPIGQPLARVN
ncbi:unnamed protein product [Nezara viridula]|uniref:Uncharacterized protein n=1 Tax=Nezara viridula TaxID=85310 RepID=A0A9P0HDI4_NEZVI|nr:unnamed protein product [Nezara viridula]